MNKLGPYELNSIITGDARELSKAIPDESVDLIFTDPVYERIEDYEWLAETAARVLKPDSFLLAYYGIGYLPETTAALSKHLNYEWHHVSYMPTYNGRGAYKTFSNYRGFLRYMKGRAFPKQHIRDLYVDTYKSSNGHHKWAKHLGLVINHIESFTNELDIVIDFFGGGGTIPAACVQTNRRYLAFEIDPDTAQLARDRVASTQPPLPLVMPVQKELGL